MHINNRRMIIFAAVYSDEFGRLVNGASPPVPAGVSFAANRKFIYLPGQGKTRTLSWRGNDTR
jgi:hypothetical protein